MRKLLFPFSLLYGAGVALRNLFFDIGLYERKKISVPVISVGNVRAGGVGKTPMVEYLVKKLRALGFRVAIVSRGYGRQTRGTLTVSDGKTILANAAEAGDEPVQMAEKLSGVVVIVDEERVRGATMAIESFGVNMIVLDDGFQHRTLHRDMDLVILTATEVEQSELLLPAGNRREFWSSLQRASIVALNRFRDLDHFHQLVDRLSRNVQQPVIGIEQRVVAVHRATTGFSIRRQNLKGKKGFLFSGIGTPESFEHTIRSLGIDITHHEIYSDHHAYSVSDLERITTLASESSTEYLFTTEKDLARIRALGDSGKEFLHTQPLFCIEIATTVVAGEEILDRTIAGLSGGRE